LIHVKNHISLQLVLIFLLAGSVFLPSCKKINEATLLGGGLVPDVDNINTFAATLDVVTDNVYLEDSSRIIYTDPVALGAITNDPEFGQTKASVYFQVSSPFYKNYPYVSRENFTVDSVVLSLDYLGGFGDTNSMQTVHVYEVSQNTTFNDTSYYRFNQPDFETTGAELGSATFAMSSLKDSMTLIRNKDTSHVANQLRIRLDNALGARLASYDTTNTPNGGYYNDTLFKALFRGFALKADNNGSNGLAYFDLSNTTKTNLTVYYKATLSGKTDTTQVTYTHTLRAITTGRSSTGGQANIITRQPAGNWATYLNNGTPQDDKLYLQSTPSGSVGYIKIPALDTFQNKLIHRAELVATRLPSEADNYFTAPGQLFVDRNKLDTTDHTKDSAFLFPEYVSFNASNIPSFNFIPFGGKLQADNTYRFNITQTVQDVLTQKYSNPTLRIYAPFDTRPFYPSQSPPSRVFVDAIPTPAYGRVVLAGGNYSDQSLRLRVRLIYSNL